MAGMGVNFHFGVGQTTDACINFYATRIFNPFTPPAAILDRSGSFINHKNRKDARAGEPVVTKQLGGPPKHLSDTQKVMWRDFARMVPEGVRQIRRSLGRGTHRLYHVEASDRSDLGR